MTRSRDFKADFSSGALDRQFYRRPDIDQVVSGAKDLRNCLIVSGGGAMRRPGSLGLVSQGVEKCRLFCWDGAVEQVHLIFRAGSVDVFTEAGEWLAKVENAPWTEEQIKSLHIEPARDAKRDECFIFHPDMPSQILRRFSPTEWTLEAFTFAQGVSDRSLQPYYRYEPPNVSMAVSRYSGVVTVQFSDGFLTAGHIGVRFRYLQANEIEISSVTSPTTATGVVRQKLYPTVILTTNVAGVGVGQVVQGEVSDRRARIVGVEVGKLIAVMLDGYDLFETIDTDGVSEIETIVAPEAVFTPSAQQVTTIPQATTVWDEQLISTERGNPSVGTIHGARLFLGGFPQAPSLVAASAIGDYDNFELGDGASDAIVERVGKDPDARVRYYLSAEQLLVFTDRSVHYVPEGGESPITPTSIEFLEIGPEGCAQVQPRLATEGALFIHDETSRLMAVTPTGNVRRSWEIVDLSEYSPHLFGPCQKLAMANGLDGRSERYVCALLETGQLTVGMYRRGGDRFGFAPWSMGRDGDGWRDIGVIGDQVYVIASEQNQLWLSRFSFAALVDNQVSYETERPDRNDTMSDIVQGYAIVADGVVADGVVSFCPPAPGLMIGADFPLRIETLPPVLKYIGIKMMRISQYWLEVLESGSVRVSGERFDAPFTGNEVADPDHVSSRVCQGITLDWNYEPTLVIEQREGEGARLEVRALSYEVAY